MRGRALGHAPKTTIGGGRAMTALGGHLRRWLDFIYNTCGAIAAGFMVLILVTIVAQMVARWSGAIEE